MKLPLEKCANGCGVPPSPPSKVICRDCMDRISKTMEGMLEKMDPNRNPKKGT